MLKNEEIRGAMTIQLGNEYPDYPEFAEGIRRAPDRGFRLTKAQTRIALKNALRYVPEELHAKLAPEFMEELTTRGRIYAYRYRPKERIYGKPIDQYKGKCLAGKAFQVMIDNNLDFDVALYPYELVTYGETGSVCQNWLQYRLIKKYLEELTEDQTLVVESGHPLGLFPSKPTAPRVIITNSIMVGMYDNLDDWEIAEEMGISEDKVREIIKIAQEPVSLETPIGEEEDSHLGDFLPDEDAPAPAEAAAFTLLKEQLMSVLSTLTPREEMVLKLRFGLEDGRQRTLEEVGKEFKVTRERIRQIEAKALRKLRHPSRSRKLKDSLD